MDEEPIPTERPEDGRLGRPDQTPDRAWQKTPGTFPEITPPGKQRRAPLTGNRYRESPS